jgi:hypothetical protein
MFYNNHPTKLNNTPFNVLNLQNQNMILQSIITMITTILRMKIRMRETVIMIAHCISLMTRLFMMNKLLPLLLEIQKIRN